MRLSRLRSSSVLVLLATLWPLSIGEADKLSHVGPTPDGTSSTFIAPRYAVVDLGAGMVPLKITNSGFVLMRDGNNNYYRWQNGASVALTVPSGYTMLEITDITEDGTTVGDGLSPALQSILLQWDGTSSEATPKDPAPRDDGSHGTISSPLISTPQPDPLHPSDPASDKVWSIQSPTGGSTDGYWNNQEIGTARGHQGPYFQGDPELGWIATGWISGYDVFPSGVNNNGYAPCKRVDYTDGTVTVIDFSKGAIGVGEPVQLKATIGISTSYILSHNGSASGTTLPFSPSSLNNNNCIIGQQSNGAYACFQASPPDTTHPAAPTNPTLPNGFIPESINAAQGPAGSAYPAYQILGYAFGNLALSEMNPQTGTFTTPVNLTSFIPQTSPWSAFSTTFGFGASQVINDGGSIVGTATYTPTNTDGTPGTPSQHGVLLLATKVTWETIGSNTPIDDNNDPVIHPPMATYQPMPGGGKRIYPDKQNPNDTGTGRNKVTLRVDAGKTAAGWKVYVQAFDIDDPTPDSVDVDKDGNKHVIDANDTDMVKQGNDNLPDTQGTGGATIPKPGFFTHGGTANDDTTLDANGKADFEFNVGYQPGNNYRVAVTFFKVDDLNNLQVTDSTQPFYVPPEENSSPSGFSGAMSPPLTVWRRLWVEQDSMAAITGNSVQGTIQSFVVDVTNNQTTVTAAANLGGDLNQFENGNVVIDSTNYPVVSTTTNIILITGQLASDANGKQFILKDDDGWGLPDTSKSMPQFGLVDSRLANDYSPAYILVMDAAQYYPHASVPFILNGCPAASTIADNYEKIPETSATCWTQYILTAYQSNTAHDGDPDTEGRDGGEHSPYGFNILYLEDMRDQLRNPFRRSFQEGLTDYMKNISMLTAHELGHGPGAGNEASQHAEGGIMQDRVFVTEKFYSTSILRFRMSQSWKYD